MGKALISKQILSTDSFRKCMEISLENLYLDIGAKGLKYLKSEKDTWPFEQSLLVQAIIGNPPPPPPG